MRLRVLAREGRRSGFAPCNGFVSRGVRWFVLFRLGFQNGFFRKFPIVSQFLFPLVFLPRSVNRFLSAAVVLRFDFLESSATASERTRMPSLPSRRIW